VTEPGLRERKKLQTRQRLSDIATTMFIERGFDAVSVADIADAAGVSKMTVFNYFSRKEELFLDRGPELTGLLTGAIQDRDPGTTPVAAVGALVLRLIDQDSPLGGFGDRFPRFWKVILESPALQAAAMQMLAELEEHLARLLAEAGEADPELVAALVMAAARVCYLRAGRRLMAGERAEDLHPEHRAFVERAFARLR
jgi:AcrR family transcriptional regulator